ncbi:LysR family transcriptional regulator [Tritonibacter mobilis]|uniref:LysR family transcriptional regulator n=1 Tax=Tritonibacter mobilis TaxID=379347 RepID=UPI001403A6CC|nr:LysR family transcriptional regulator [Tritonibacter mobilis]NHM19816.1 LysR family transcriptional regulator [Tritonibacter mobilis]NHM23965.1 LysR family transcriptional regulator [Tritonibacter mobilis]
MDALETKFLREFLAVAHEGSIRRAADRLNVVPSAISRKIAEAEARLGVTLFERSSKGVVLTEAGELLREHAQHMRDEQTYLLDQIGHFRDGRSQIVRIATGEGFAADLMENGLLGLTRAHPELRFVIDHAGTDELQRKVIEGESDIGIAYNPLMTEATRSLAHSRQSLCAIVPRNSPLAERTSVSLAEVLEHPVAMLNAGYAIRHLVGQAAADRGLALRVQVETASIPLLIRYVCAGVGVSFLPRFSATSQAERGDLAVLDVEETSLQQVSTHLMVRARRRLPRSVSLVARHLAENMLAFRD